jgi:hypothetical protein
MCRVGPVNGRCEFNSCDRTAVGLMHGQWTLFDFDEWEVCEMHITDAVMWANGRTVDGQPLADLWWDWYDDDLEGHGA